MRVLARKPVLKLAAATLAVTALLHGIGRVLPRGMVRVSQSGTSATHLVFGPIGVGVSTVSDPSGYVIPFVSKLNEHVDIKRGRQDANVGNRLVFNYWQVTYPNRQGNPVVVRSWYAIYLPLAALATFVVGAHVLALGYERARAGVAALRAARHAWQYPAGEHCPACGYDVRESASRCPECGQAFVRRTVVLRAS